MSDARWRLLRDGAARGDWNMAVDEALLEAVLSGGLPTLRFYDWQPACLSLGYFQRFEVVDPAGCRAQGVDIVRRPTGGRAILHDRELTYSVSLPAAALGHDAGVLPSYHRISRALQAGLASAGVDATMASESAAPTTADHGPICFDRPSAHEILLDGRKLVGSAQVRRGNALLQHGSIVIEPQTERMLACLANHKSTGPRDPDLRSRVAGLSEVGLIDRDQLAGAMTAAFEREFGVECIPGRLTPAEAGEATRLVTAKYGTPSWTERPLLEAAINTTRTR